MAPTSDSSSLLVFALRIMALGARAQDGRLNGWASVFLINQSAVSSELKPQNAGAEVAEETNDRPKGDQGQGEGWEISQYVIIQTHDLRIAEQQIEVLERLGQPKRLHFVTQARFGRRDVTDGRKAVRSFGGAIDGFEHGPALVTPALVTGDAVHDEDGLDGFGSA